MADELDGGWGDLSDPAPANVDTGTGEIHEDIDNTDPELLVAQIVGSPEALALLKDALGLGAEKPDKLRVFATLEEFMDEYFLRTFRKNLEAESRLSWCEQWERHPEAHAAFDALWERWEEDRRSAGGVAHWFQYYAWPFLDRLTTPDTSPFAGCKHTSEHTTSEHNGDHQQVLPTAVSPDGVFPVYPTKANPNP